MKFLRIVQNSNGTVFGLDTIGRISQFDAEGVREFALFRDAAGDFENCRIIATITPEPQPMFTVEDLDVSDDGSCLLLKGYRPEDFLLEFGVLRLDRKLQIGNSSEFLAPLFLHVPNIELNIECIKWFPETSKSFCVLSKSGVISIHDVDHPSDPIRHFRLERNGVSEFGMTSTLVPKPVDLAFADSGPWSGFTLFVLYSDGGVYALSPVLPAGECSDEVLQAAAGQPVPSTMIRKLLIDVRSYQGGVPVLQGPLNGGLESEWGDEFGLRGSDKAVCFSSASAGNGIVSFTICTALGKVYSHLLIKPINPRLIALPEAIISSKNERICSSFTPLQALQLMEIIDIKTSPRKKENITLFQNKAGPDVAHVDYGGKIYRLWINWINGSLASHTVVERFEKDLEFIGVFQELNAFISVFQNPDSIPLFIWRPSCIRKSLMANSTGLPKLQSGAPVLQDIIQDSNNPALIQLKQAKAEFNGIKTQDGELESVLEQLEDTASFLEDKISDLETDFKSLNLLTPSSVQTCNTAIRASKQNAVLESQLNSFASLLTDLEDQY